MIHEEFVCNIYFLIFDHAIILMALLKGVICTKNDYHTITLVSEKVKGYMTTLVSHLHTDHMITLCHTCILYKHNLSFTLSWMITKKYIFSKN